MLHRASRAVIADFISEVRDYLPSVRQAIASLRRPGAVPAQALDEPQRLLHTIKGAASMIGLTALSRLAFLHEELIEDVMAGMLPWSAEAEAALESGLDRIGLFLDQLEEGRGAIAPLARAIVHDFRRLRQFSPAGDEAEIAALLADAGELEAASQASATETEGVAPQPTGPQDERPESATGFATGELAATFQLEAEELVETIGAALRALDSDPANNTLLNELRRPVHTLKGSASTVGARMLSHLAHRMEDLLDLVGEGAAAYTADTGRLLADSLDLLTDLANGAAANPTTQAASLEQRYAAVLEAPPSSLPAAPPAPRAAEAPMPEIPATPEAAPAQPQPQAPDQKLSGQWVRVPIERLDEMVRLAGELVVNRSSFEQTLGAYRHELDELRLSMERLKRLIHRFESGVEAVGLDPVNLGTSTPAAPLASAGDFDALEFDRYTGLHLLSRELAEASADIGAAVGALGQRSGDFSACLERLARLTTESEDKLRRMRMVPLGSLAGRLHRAVRVAASNCSKLATLSIEGEWIELDKTVLEQIAGPLEHLLRNSVDHGIEPASVRAALGKPEQGRIVLRAWHEGAEVVLQAADDGAGLDSTALRETAIRKGFLSEADAANLTEDEVLRLIFQPGFSTAAGVTEVSGRGVGMDALRTAVQAMRGSVGIENTPGQGARFTIRLPLTLAVMRVLLVEAGGERMAIPLASVVQVLRLEPSRIESAGGKKLVRLDREVLPGIALHDALGLRRPPNPAGGRPPAIVVQAAGLRAVLLVDQVLEAREAVIKTLGSLVRRAPGIAGSTLMGDGAVVLILNPGDLLGDISAARPAAGPTRLPRPRVPAAEANRALHVMVVDDSVSVRRVLENLLQSAGWRALPARDGVEALDLLRGGARPDVVMVDIEMPRMDGYELTAALRAHPQFKHLPILMLTSRAGEKHRTRAFDLGVTDYLVKPYQEETLLAVLRRLAREHRQREAS